MCAKDDLVRRKGLLSTSTQTPNHVDTFGSDFAFSLKADQHFFVYQNILSLIAFIISYRPFADELLVYVTIRNLSCEARRQRSTPSTLLARFIPTTKIRDPFLKTLENAAKSRILLACADRRTRQCYLTICAILADYEEQVLLTSIKKNRYCTRCTKHYNFNIHVSLATDTLHLLLKGLVIKMLDFMQDMLDDIYPSKQKAIIQQLVAVVSPLFISKAPFALHFIRAVCDLVTLAQYKSHDEDTLAYIQGALERMNIFKEEFRHALTHIIQDIRMYGALDSICTRANSEAHHITILIPGIQPHSTKLPLSEVAANIAISNFTHAAAVRISVQIHPSIKCWRSSSKRHNDPKHCDEEVHRDNRRQSRTVTDGRVVAQLYLILTIIDHTCYDKDGKHMAYIRAFSEVLLFNNNKQIDNTTRMLSFYDLSTIIRSVHLVPRDLPNSTTRTTMSYYVNNYIDWDEYNRLYSPIFDINLLRTLREYRRKRTRNN
ncbi:hypothetical protein HBH46_088780 [Parastagonospora nodorum]|nr:hypothetical protein HBH46_088780 [Parastagonospora nodorum]